METIHAEIATLSERITGLEEKSDERAEGQKDIKRWLMSVAFVLLLQVCGIIWFFATEHAELGAIASRQKTALDRLDTLWLDYHVRKNQQQPNKP